ncbi:MULTISPECIES: GNAT family N-acetyltransferase [unclassified Pseudonocardia]|uniref:GNAT family N-acetyltransferase n=1 Tax=unclassified Pseudonocardia TaxID=2619320 RepID=UPI00095FEE60|nr:MULTISPECIES: GNAT family N-acetyltransferase [unclassified Pseudonocardia]MBN9101756.1 GNAT family N-acetyltransferase [Pseudonocardia sp.]OJY49985.1 MAG: GNAT family N-acetyltransferase [Pseudonocardia sp. 73-21]
MDDVDDQRLTAHLQTWLGRWPGTGPGLTVVGSAKRVEPGWDGLVHPVLGVESTEGGVLSVPPLAADAVAAVVAAGDDGPGVPAAAKIDGGFFRGVFRWSTAPTPLPDAGVWVPAVDPSVPEWLRPFGHDVLVAVDPDTGEHLAGVGIKRHDGYGHELAVVTAEAAQGKGLARRLVAQAARRVLDEGAIPTYLHAHSNIGSAKVAEASGFPDRGWSILGVG